MIILWRGPCRFLRKLGLALSGFSWGEFGAVYCFCAALMCSVSSASRRGDFLQGPGGGDLLYSGADTNGHPCFAPEVCSKEGTSGSASRALPLVGQSSGGPRSGH